MNQNKPLTSVIIPVYNGENYIQEALESVFQQDYQALEVIVIDDGSTDKTQEIIKNTNLNIKYVYQENQGASAARNHGLKIAQGKYIAFLDADDLWHPQALNIQFQCLNKYPDAEIVLGKTQLVDFTNVPIDEPCFVLHLASAVYEKSVFNQVGLLDENLDYSDDLDWFNRAREQNINIIKHEHTVLFYRQHDRNMTKQKTCQELKILKVLKKSLNRRRQKQSVVDELPKIEDVKLPMSPQ